MSFLEALFQLSWGRTFKITLAPHILNGSLGTLLGYVRASWVSLALSCAFLGSLRAFFGFLAFLGTLPGALLDSLGQALAEDWGRMFKITFAPMARLEFS